MLFYLFLSSRSPLEYTLLVLGGLVPVAALVFAIWSALKRFAEKRHDRKKEEEAALGERLTTLQTTIGQLDISTSTTKEQYQRFRAQVEQALSELKKQVQELQAQHIMYQHATDVSDLEKKVERLANRVDRVADDLAKHRESINERFLTIESYKSDLNLWTNTFNALRQDIRDTNLLIKGGRS